MGYLVTPGAAGTKALEAVGGLALKNGDPSFNTHNRDTSCVPPDARVAYVYSNAFDTILSFWRRGFMKDPAHAFNLGVHRPTVWTGPDKLETWLHNMELDPFKLREHMSVWFCRPGTLFVKYETLSDNMGVRALSEHIGADLSGFKFKRRNSRWVVEPHGVIGRLARLYGDLMEIQYALPDTWLTV
jgi:hypothetical protein